jgi:hypothetical protein
VVARVSALTKSVIAEVPAVEVEVAAMPVGGDLILSEVGQAILDRAQKILKQIQRPEGATAEPTNTQGTTSAQLCV